MKSYPSEVIETIFEEFRKSKPFSEIAIIVNEKHDVSLNGTMVKGIIEREGQKMASAEYSTVIDGKDITAAFTENKNKQTDRILKNLNETLDVMEVYKTKILSWIDRLESDMKLVYDEKDPSLSRISHTFDQLIKLRHLVNADVDSFEKAMNTSTKLMQLMQPTEIKVNRMDMNLNVNNALIRIEKYGYFMVKPETEEAAELLKKMFEKNEITRFTK